MKVNINKINLVILLIYILIKLFLPGKYDTFFSVLYILVTLILYIFQYKEKKEKSFLYLIFLILFVFLLFFTIFFIDINIKDTLLTFAFLICSVAVFSSNKKNIIYINRDKIFYILSTGWLIFFFVYSFFNNTLDTYDFYLTTTVDKNYTAIVIFIFFCYCFKKKYKIGFLISLLYSFFLKSRLLILSIVIFVILKIILIFIDDSAKIFKMTYKSFVFIIFFSTFLITLFSYYMVHNSSIFYVSQYGESIYDSSNAIRVRANVYAIEKIKADKKLLLRGYDEKTMETIGIVNGISPIYLGYRLVQPHNFVLNGFLKLGCILTIVYVFLISRFFSMYNSKENLPIILTYIFINMFMHSLMTNAYLLFLLFVLASNQNNCWRKEK